MDSNKGNQQEMPPGYSAGGWPAGYEQQQHQAPPPGYQGPPPMQQAQGQPVPRPMYVDRRAFGKAPVTTTCPNCKASITTSIDRNTGLLQHGAAAVLCLFGCWLGCCLIPYCIDSMQDVTHSCPNCNFVLGKYQGGL